MDMTLSSGGTWDGADDIIAYGSAVDVDTSAAAAGLGVGAEFPSSEDNFGEIGEVLDK